MQISSCQIDRSFQWFFSGVDILNKISELASSALALIKELMTRAPKIIFKLGRVCSWIAGVSSIIAIAGLTASLFSAKFWDSNCWQAVASQISYLASKIMFGISFLGYAKIINLGKHIGRITFAGFALSLSSCILDIWNQIKVLCKVSEESDPSNLSQLSVADATKLKKELSYQKMKAWLNIAEDIVFIAAIILAGITILNPAALATLATPVLIGYIAGYSLSLFNICY